MEKIVQHWIEGFHQNFPLPPPLEDEGDPMGWSINIKELQNFSLSHELKTIPDTATFGIKIYLSIFNTSTGQFHGRTWSSPLITDVKANFINLTSYGIICGKNSLIVIEFSFCVKYLNNETNETSLFFTVLPIPEETTPQICPLYTGTPRILMAMPNNFSNLLAPRPGGLLVELQKYDELLNASTFLPYCTFFNQPIPGIKSFAPLSLEQTTPLSITGVIINPNKNFEESLHNELLEIFSQKYKIPSDKIHMRVVRFLMQFAIHNTHKFISETLKAEVSSINGWSFDGQILFPDFVKGSPNFALIFQLLICIEIDLSFLESTKLIISTPISKEKQIFEVPLGYGIVNVTTDSFMTIKLSRAARNSPFGMRILQTETQIPTVSFNVSFNPQLGQDFEKRDFAVDFKLLIAEDGGTLLPLDPKNIPEEPLLMEEFTDNLNTNHLLFLFKFLVPRQSFFERFPVKIFRNVYIQMDIWPFGLIKSEVCRLSPFQDTLIFYQIGSKKDNERGVIISKNVSLKAYEQVVNYFFLMKANELQASIVDADTDIIIGHFNIQSSSLLRQKRHSLQLSTYSKLTGADGELLGNVHFAYGCYGTADHKIVKLDFDHRNPIQKDFIISRSIADKDENFKKAVRSSVLPRFELAARYRDGRRKEAMLSDLQKKFLRTRILYPIPGLESRFVFTSVYDPEEPATVYVQPNDERIRFIRKLDKDELTSDTDSPDRVYHLERDETLEFNQQNGVPISERFNLNVKKKSSFKAKPGEEIRLLFAFFSVTDFEENEISVSLNDDTHTLLDCFTVHIKKTVPLAQENIYLFTHKEGTITTTLNSMYTYSSAISSSSLITATTSIFGTRITSLQLTANLLCYIFCFAKDNSLRKIVRLHVDVLPDEILTADSKLKINIPKYIGSKICCKTSDTRIAQFLNYEEPLVLRDPGDVTAKALSSGIVKLVIYNISQKAPAVSIYLSVIETKNEGGKERLIGKSEITLQVGRGAKKTLEYRNNTSHRKSIRLTTSHPEYIHFDPTHYEIEANKSARLRLIFLPNNKEEYVLIHVFVQESDQPRALQEYYKLNVHYAAIDDDDSD